MTAPVVSPQAVPCPACGTEVAASLLACPACRALVHREALERLAAGARAAESRGDTSAALMAWRDALMLLPRDARQRDVIDERIASLTRAATATPATAPDAPPKPVHHRAWAGVVAAAVFLLGKGKLLLLGLTKLKTLLSMAAFFGVYWSQHGWIWALGLVLCIYVHEMGHVAVLARYGVRASAPMFIPGLGAFITMQQHLSDARQEARVGLAGPVWGLGAGLAALGLARYSGVEAIAAVAATAGFVNLFNLVPVWQLDGAHAFKALVRWQRVALAVALLALWELTGTGMAGAVGLVALVVAFIGKPTATEPDHGAFGWFLGVAAALSWLAATHAPG